MEEGAISEITRAIASGILILPTPGTSSISGARSLVRAHGRKCLDFSRAKVMERAGSMIDTHGGRYTDAGVPRTRRTLVTAWQKYPRTSARPLRTYRRDEQIERYRAGTARTVAQLMSIAGTTIAGGGSDSLARPVIARRLLPQYN